MLTKLHRNMGHLPNDQTAVKIFPLRNIFSLEIPSANYCYFSSVIDDSIFGNYMMFSYYLCCSVPVVQSSTFEKLEYRETCHLLWIYIGTNWVYFDLILSIFINISCVKYNSFLILIHRLSLVVLYGILWEIWKIIFLIKYYR